MWSQLNSLTKVITEQAAQAVKEAGIDVNAIVSLILIAYVTL